MYQLHTDPEHYSQLATLLDGVPRYSADGDAAFNRVLSVLNATNEIITLASSIGQPEVEGKRVLYVHMAVTETGAELVARLYQRIQRRIHDDWDNKVQPIGVLVRPSAVQIYFNYYESHGMWFQAMILQCSGMRTETNQRYLLNILHQSIF